MQWAECYADYVRDSDITTPLIVHKSVYVFARVSIFSSLYGQRVSTSNNQSHRTMLIIFEQYSNNANRTWSISTWLP